MKVMSESIGTTEESISEEVDEKPASFNAMEDDDVDDDDDDELEMDFELQRKLIRARKLFHRSKIQDVIKEGQDFAGTSRQRRTRKQRRRINNLSVSGRTLLRFDAQPH